MLKVIRKQEMLGFKCFRGANFEHGSILSCSYPKKVLRAVNVVSTYHLSEIYYLLTPDALIKYLCFRTQSLSED